MMPYDLSHDRRELITKAILEHLNFIVNCLTTYDKSLSYCTVIV